jgi:hypothetical protein
MGRSAEINVLLVMAIQEMGLGYAALGRLATCLGIKNMDNKTYRTINKRVAWHTTRGTDAVLKNAVEAVKQTYTYDLEEHTDGPVDIAVSFDGTWHKRGFTSHYGMGCVIEITTGLVVDYIVFSMYCHACKMAEDKYVNIIELEKWKTKHQPQCNITFNGTAKAMEKEAAVRL